MEKNALKLKLLSPEELFEKIKLTFNKERRKIFIIAFIFGIIIHFLLLNSLITSQDGILNSFHYTAGNYEDSLGRWGIDIFDSLRNNIGLPFITTIISVILMSFCSIMIIELFEIKSDLFKILTILSIVASPCINITLIYTYTADVYIWSMFFSILSIYCFCKIKNKVLRNVFGITSFIIELSLYQSYMGMTIAIILMLLLKELLNSNSNYKTVLKELIFFVIRLFILAVLYYIVTIIILKCEKIEISTYQGVNEISILKIFTNIIPSIKNAYLGFIKYFFADGIVLNRTWGRDKLYIAFFILSIICGIFLAINLIRNSQNKKDAFIKLGLFSIGLILIPIGLNIVAIMAPGSEMYILTSTQLLLIFPFIFTLYEQLKKDKIVLNILKYIMIIVSIELMISYIISTIVTYQTTQLSFEQLKNISNRVINRMEECEGYRSDMKTIFVGNINDVNFPKTIDLYNFANTNMFRFSLMHGNHIGLERSWKNIMNFYMGKFINSYKEEEYIDVVESEDFKEMDIFPGKNSVRIINDIMVVKFENQTELSET